MGAISALRPDDYAIGGYREHGHGLAKGCDPRRPWQSCSAGSTGSRKGKGGSMHFFDKERNFLGGTGIVGGQLPHRDRRGLAIKYRAATRSAWASSATARWRRGYSTSR